jgi:predicted amidohydrolase YtcJ
MLPMQNDPSQAWPRNTVAAVPWLAVALSLTAVSAAGGGDSREAVDLLLFNGKVVTVDDTFSIAQAVAVSGGRIVAVGGNELTARLDPRKSIDLHGRTLLPGFIDTHSHILAEAFLARSVDLAAIDSLAALKDAIRRKVRELGPGRWITGINWSEDYLAERRRPTRWDLDAAAPDNPVILWRMGGHSSVSNSRALRIAGVGSKTPDPAGGVVERGPDGVPTGLIRERSDLVADFISRATPAELKSAVRAGLLDHLRYGVTSLINANVGPDDYALYEQIYAESADLLPRAALQIAPQIDPNGSTTGAIAQLRAFGRKTGDGNERLRVGALKVYVDGGYTGASAYTLEPYVGQPEYFGKLMVPEPELYRLVAFAHAAGWQMGFHTIGDGASALAVRVIGRVLDESPRNDHRHYLNHMSVMPPASVLAAMALHNIWVAQQPNFTYTYDALYARHLAGERLERNNPLRSLEEKGVFFAFGGDIVPLNPIVGLYAAVTRIGRTTGRRFALEERLTMPDALYRYTRAGAFFTREEALKGSIKPGMLADFVVLSQDPLTVAEDKLLATRATMTIVGGNVVYVAPDSQEAH